MVEGEEKLKRRFWEKGEGGERGVGVGGSRVVMSCCTFGNGKEEKRGGRSSLKLGE